MLCSGQDVGPLQQMEIMGPTATQSNRSVFGPSQASPPAFPASAGALGSEMMCLFDGSKRCEVSIEAQNTACKGYLWS